MILLPASVKSIDATAPTLPVIYQQVAAATLGGPTLQERTEESMRPIHRTITVSCVLLCAVAGQFCTAETKDASKTQRDSVALFSAIDNDRISVRYVAMSARKGSIILRNDGDEEVILELPDAFGAMPALGQAGPPGIGAPFGGNGGGQGQGFAGQGFAGGGFAAQGLGGAFGNGGGGQGQQGFGQQGFGRQGIGGPNGRGFGQAGGLGPGFFRVPANSTKHIKVRTVCLEYGKPDPTPRMNYRLVPIEGVSKDPHVKQLCASLSDPEQDQSAVQAAAWNVANNLSWDTLTRINRVQSKYTGNQRYFDADNIDQAQRLVAALRPKPKERYITSDSAAAGD